MRILLLHQFFLMPGMPGGSRFNELTRHWQEAGHEVTVVAGSLDYASGTVPERYRGKWFVHEQQEGIDMYRCHVPSSYNDGYGGRAWAYLGFTLSATTAAMAARRPDVIIATSPGLTIVVPGFLAAKLRRRAIPWVFEIRDLWPESAVTTGVLSPHSAITRALYVLERWACKAADKINVLTPAFQKDLVARGLAAADKITFVPNGVDPDEFVPGPRDNAFRREQGWGERFVVLYAGAHGRANALMQLVRAAELLKDRPDIHIASIGNGPERQGLLAEVERLGLTNISFPGAQPKARMPEVIRACDVGAAVLQDNPTFHTVYPNKVFDYMAAERPVLLAIGGVAKEMVVDQAQAGIYVEPEAPAAFAAAVRRLADMPADERADLGRRGRSWVIENVSRPQLAARYAKILADLVLTRAQP